MAAELTSDSYGMSASKTGPSKGQAKPKGSQPNYAQFDSEHTQIGAGVAIFHLKSEKVVVCYHTRDKYWFLPKGRKDAGEGVERAACREGFEEVSD